MDSAAAGYRLDPDNPWPGLAWFDESAQAFFNGRGREVNELRRLVSDATLTVLFGRSGLGKTSLLKAGLFPALRKAKYLPVYLRVNFNPPAGDAGPLVDQLFTALTRACSDVGADAPPRRPGDSLWEYLHRTDTKIWSKQNERLTPVFVLDQFEEVFTLGSANPQVVMRLREDLADLAENRIPVATEQRIAGDPETETGLALRGVPYRVVLSFREDFATAFERWHELPSLLRNRLQLLPMTGKQALEAVRGSAAHLVDEPTAERIVRFVASERRSGPAAETAVGSVDDLTVEPALLSLVCRGLNSARQERRDRGGPNRIDAQLVSATGPGVIDRHYDTCMQDQSERVHRFVESELVTESGFRNPCAQDDALREPYRIALDSLQVLVDRRVLRFEPSLGVTRVELIHDLLAPTVVTQRDARRRQDQKTQLEEDLRQAEHARQAIESERRAKRRLWMAMGTATIAVLVAVGVGSLAFYARRQAIIAGEQSQIATAERQAATLQAKISQSRELASAAITRLELDPELAVRLALEADKVRQTDQAVSALRQALFRWRGSSAGGGRAGLAMLPGRDLRGHLDDVMGVAFSPDGTRLLSVGCDTTARLWDAETGAEIFVLRDHRAPLWVGAFSRDGLRMLTAGGNPCLMRPTTEPEDAEIRVWDTRTGHLSARLAGSPSLLVGAAFNASGGQIAAGGIAGQVLAWTLATGQMRVIGVQGDELEPAIIQAVEYSPDGRQLATAAQDGTVAIWNAETGARLKTLKHDTKVLALAYGGTADGNMSLATVDESGVAKLWDARTFELRREIRSYSGALYSTSFSRDGRFLVTAGNELSLWETTTGARMQVIPPRDRLYAVSMSANGRKIAVGGEGGSLRLIDCDVCVSIDELRTLAAGRPPRELTDRERRDFLGFEP